MESIFIQKISRETGISVEYVANTLQLLAGGATIPFIARYRKEMTGSLDELQIAQIRDRYEQLTAIAKRRDAIIESLKEQEKLTPELQKQLFDAQNLSELEDIYLPFKPKRKTRATIAIAKGLEPLAREIFMQTSNNLEEMAKHFISPEKEVYSIEEALSGAKDIVAEWINEDQRARKSIRILFEKEAIIFSKVKKGKELEGRTYEHYFKHQELLNRAPSHRILAMFRGEDEGFLQLTIQPSEEKALELLEKIFIKTSSFPSPHLREAIHDGYKRLLSSSIETEIRAFFKEKADREAIRVFVDNLRQLLLAPPLGQKRVLAIDPGFRTGCKVVCLDEQGNLLHNETIYPHPPQSEVKQSAQKIESLVEAYKIQAIAIGNGTAGRETERLVRSLSFKHPLISVMVNESGASIYSASAVAREEFPDYDVTVRGAVSIGRRLMDPLAELVKIDPKSIGVGQYQHDVNQNWLQKSLNETVESCVNLVGVEVNTASKELLTYVSGVGPVLAKNIVEYRKTHGPFRSREALKKVPRFGEKAFEQAVGFLRIRKGDNPLDQSAVHPESYFVVEKMAKKLQVEIDKLIGNPTLVNSLNLKEFVTEKIGLPTLHDIVEELKKPGRDPREPFGNFQFDETVNSIEDIKPGMKLPGIVTNITAFGVFVDIGVHQDGLIHISQLANKYVSDPNQVVKLRQHLTVKVLDVDYERKRIQLTLKDL